MFKADSRRAKGTKERRFEGFIHAADPIVSPCSDGYCVAIPSTHGGASFYGSTVGPFDTEESALSFAIARMEAGGWHHSRSDAEAAMTAELSFRSTHRRVKRAGGKFDYIAI